MTRNQRVAKRLFDLAFSLTGLLLFGWLIVLAAVAARIDTGASGIFRQDRVGRHGKIFRIMKIRTMRPCQSTSTHVTTTRDPRITRLGSILRRFKLDELPQLLNVLRGDMSFVGPRPDVSGFADRLQGREQLVLSVRPGITGPATLEFRAEEELLARCPEPERYNREVIYPRKVAINLQYIEQYRFRDDLLIIWKTLAS